MGQSVSTEQVAAHLARQEQLIQQLRLVVEKQARSIEGYTAQHVSYEVDSRGTIEAPEYLCDELDGLKEITRRRERARAEPPITADERAVPDAVWALPTEEEERDFMSVKPWLGAMAPPTGFTYGKTDGMPDVHLELEHVYGWRCSNVRNNMFWVNDHTILYYAAAVGIVHNLKTNKQFFFQSHADDIVSMAFDQQRGVVATGEQGRFPALYVWDVSTGEMRAKLAGTHRRAVVALAFSADGSRVASVGLDDQHTFILYDWATGSVVAHAPCGTNRVLDICADYSDNHNPDTDFVTVGVKHIHFWSYNNGNGKLTSTRGLLGNIGEYQPFLAVRSTPLYSAIVGCASGELYLFKGNRLVNTLTCHQNAVNALRCIDNILYTGGYDGCVNKINLTSLTKESSLNVNKAHPPEVLSARSVAIRALDTFIDTSSPSSEPKLLVGTLAGTVFSGYVHTPAPLLQKHLDVHHPDLGSVRSDGELWGLAAAPKGTLFATCAEDATLRVWDAAERTLLKSRTLDYSAQCCAISPDCHTIAVGFLNGLVGIYDATTDNLVDLCMFKRCNRRVQCLRYSPDGTLLAAGHADNAVDIYAVEAPDRYRFKGKLTGNTSVILKIDFSADGKYLQTCSQSYELLFFELETLKQYTRSRDLKDVKWATFTSILGWDVQGVWPKNSDGSDINSVARSHNSKYLVSAEDTGLVKLFNYPCVGGGLDKRGVLSRRPESQRAVGHSEHVTEVAWSADDSRVFSVGGLDRSVLQWRVVKE